MLYAFLGTTIKILRTAGYEPQPPGWTAWLLLLPLLAIVLYTLWRALEGKGVWGQRAERRAAIKALAKGDFDAGEVALLEILAAAPDDVEARLLLAHACTAAGRYGDAAGCLGLVPEEHAARLEMEYQLEIIREMEAHGGEWWRCYRQEILR